MASHQTGDDMTAGDLNFANNMTCVVACRTDDREDYNGFTVLLVGPDPEPRQRPTSLTDGVTGYGYLGGCGVRGLGCPLDGPQGEGKGAGTGGIGVIGNGGSGDLNQNAANVAGVGDRAVFEPGAGVLGTGGFWTGGLSSNRESESGRKTRDARGGAGVIGVAGSEHQSPVVPSFDDTQGVGVYGFSTVGRGVVAEGNTSRNNGSTGLSAKGLRGIEAIGTVNGIDATGGAIGLNATSTGALGAGGPDRYGVQADGADAGIYAIGRREGPAGIFEVILNEKVPRAQLHIKPIELQVAVPSEESFAPTAYTDVSDNVDWLPRKGKIGEILVTREIHPDDPAPPRTNLWICVEAGGNVGDPSGALAMWRQVLLGPQIKGERG